MEGPDGRAVTPLARAWHRPERGGRRHRDAPGADRTADRSAHHSVRTIARSAHAVDPAGAPRSGGGRGCPATGRRSCSYSCASWPSGAARRRGDAGWGCFAPTRRASRAARATSRAGAATPVGGPGAVGRVSPAPRGLDRRAGRPTAVRAGAAAGNTEPAASRSDPGAARGCSADSGRARGAHLRRACSVHPGRVPGPVEDRRCPASRSGPGSSRHCANFAQGPRLFLGGRRRPDARGRARRPGVFPRGDLCSVACSRRARPGSTCPGAPVRSHPSLGGPGATPARRSCPGPCCPHPVAQLGAASCASRLPAALATPAPGAAGCTGGPGRGSRRTTPVTGWSARGAGARTGVARRAGVGRPPWRPTDRTGRRSREQCVAPAADSGGIRCHGGPRPPTIRLAARRTPSGTPGGTRRPRRQAAAVGPADLRAPDAGRGDAAAVAGRCGRPAHCLLDVSVEHFLCSRALSTGILATPAPLRTPGLLPPRPGTGRRSRR
jgi:hypothetical protein